MALSCRVVGGLVFILILASWPAFAIRKKDGGASGNGSFANCGTGEGVCAYLGTKGTVTLAGKDKSGNAVTATIDLYDWGFYPCGDTSCNPVVNSAVLDVTLTGTDTAGIESLAIKGALSSPSYVSCGFTTIGIACIYAPEPDGEDAQEPTPIAGADTGGHVNTRWDFGGLPPDNPPLPAIPFDQLQCISSYFGHDTICNFSPLGEAILTVTNSVAKNKLGTNPANYLVTLTDGTQLGTLAVPAYPTKQVAKTNNTQATATVISKTKFKDYTDASLAYPQINADGTEQYPDGFTPLPLTNPPPCNPPGDNRTFRTAWYSYTAPSNGSLTLSTAGSRYDTLIYVFTGSASLPTVISCNDDPFPSNGLVQAVTSFNVTQGTNYQIMVGETPTIQTTDSGSLTGYPLSVSSALHFNLTFSTSPVKSPTVTTLTSFPNPSNLGQTVNFTAKVDTNGAGSPSGTVTFNDGSTTLGTSPVSGGIATLSTAALAAGVHSITATYSGDSNFTGSTSAVLSQGVLATTTTTLTSSLNPSKPGVAVTFTATVTSSGGTPAGSVQFLNGDTPLKTVTLVSGVAKYKTTKLPLGSNIITAIYTGDFDGSTSNSVNQIVEVDLPTILHSFSGGTDGNFPAAGLLLDAQGNLYGTTEGDNGNGTVFKIDAKGQETVLYNFTGNGGDGYFPVAGLVQDAQGNLYGTTELGGDLGCPVYSGSGCGIVFELSPPAGGSGPWTETILYSFTAASGDGAVPEAGLTLDAQGNLYGTTFLGGNLACPPGYTQGCGTVFKLTHSGGTWNETVLYRFTAASGDGDGPNSTLAMDASGNLYGTTLWGGDPSCAGFYGCGTVFKVTAAGQETPIHAFSGVGGDGKFPEGGLILDASGNLYGTTNGGGNESFSCINYQYGCGIIFKMTATGQQTVLYSFVGGNDGASPAAGVILDNKGNIYGTTTEGGDLTCAAGDGYGCGNAFKFTPTGHVSILHIFFGTGGDGQIPEASLVSDPVGNLYGTTMYGGDFGEGTVFKLAPQ